jgi:hypothetical protein
MRAVVCRIFFAATTTAVVLRAQVAAPPSVDIAPKKTVRPTPNPTASPEPTIPPDLPDVSKLDEVFKQSSLGSKADESRLHAEWRGLRNQVVNLPDVVAAKKAADAARTDLQKRQLLRRYYEICYAHMEALAQAPELKAGLELMKKEHLGTLDQPRVRPSRSATPTPTSETAAESATPSPTPSPSAEEESEGSG